MDKKVSLLMQKKQPEQLSKEWFDMRKNCITASSAASLLVRDSVTCDTYIQEYKLQNVFKKDGKCCNPYSSKLDYIKNKVLGSTFKGSVATYWGQKYEQIVQDIYSVNNKTQVLEFGLLPHNTIPFLACSPDGITPNGVMLEIKCPFRRVIDGIPPFYYFIQVQIQLETCDLEVCDFVEYSFVEFGTKEEWLDDETLDIPIYNRGLFIQIESLDSDGNLLGPEKNEYVYPDKKYIDDQDALIGWSDYYMSNVNRGVKGKRFSIVYYKVNDLSVVRIKRDRVWFQNVLPVFKKEWEKIVYYRQGNNHLKLKEEDICKEDTPYVTIHLGRPPGFEDTCILSETESEN